MNHIITRLHYLVLIWLCSISFLHADEQTDLQLTLPEQFYAVVGSEMNLYFANTILAEKTNAYRFQVECELGQADETHWSLTPVESNVGQHVLKLTVTDETGNKLGSAQTTLVVVPEKAGQGKEVRLLIVGDSLTHASHYPNEIARLLKRPGNPKFEMLGTHKPKGAMEGVAHEGYGGWTWVRFLKHYEPKPDGTYRKQSSPFVFKGADGTPGLDVQRYINEHCDGVPPNFIIFKLGINDCFHVKPDDSAAVEKKIKEVFGYADQLVAAVQKVAPETTIGICLTTPGNARDEAFDANYKGRYPRWGWKRIQHRLVQRQLEHFRGQEANHIFIIPTELNLDTVKGYPDNNAVHPNKAGYDQIGTTIYAWLKFRLDQER